MSDISKPLNDHGNILLLTWIQNVKLNIIQLNTNGGPARDKYQSHPFSLQLVIRLNSVGNFQIEIQLSRY